MLCFSNMASKLRHCINNKPDNTRQSLIISCYSFINFCCELSKSKQVNTKNSFAYQLNTVYSIEHHFDLFLYMVSFITIFFLFNSMPSTIKENISYSKHTIGSYQADVRHDVSGRPVLVLVATLLEFLRCSQ